MFPWQQLHCNRGMAFSTWSKSHRTHDHILLSHLRLPPPLLEGQVLVFISPKNRVVQSYPRALGSLFVPLQLAGLWWRYSNPPPHGVKLKSHYDRRSLGQFFLVSCPFWGKRPGYIYLSDNYFQVSQSQSYFTTDGQSVSMSWCRAQSGTFDQRYIFFFFFLKLQSCLIWGALSDERSGLSFVSLVSI
jgi:hypothetical protein